MFFKRRKVRILLPKKNFIRLVLVYLKEWVKDFHNIFQRVVPRLSNGDISRRIYSDFHCRLIQNKKICPSLCAVIRMKSGELFVGPLILNISSICHEIVVVENEKFPKSKDIVEQLALKLRDHCKISYHIYPEVIERYGPGYGKRVLSNPSGSIAKFYNWCISKSSSDYVWKVDLNCLFSLTGLDYLQKAVMEKPDVILIDGQDCGGRLISFERRVFKKRSDFFYKDGDEWEYVELPLGSSELRLRRPIFLHAGGLYSPF